MKYTQLLNDNDANLVPSLLLAVPKSGLHPLREYREW